MVSLKGPAMTRVPLTGRSVNIRLGHQLRWLPSRRRGCPASRAVSPPSASQTFPKPPLLPRPPRPCEKRPPPETLCRGWPDSAHRPTTGNPAPVCGHRATCGARPRRRAFGHAATLRRCSRPTLVSDTCVNHRGRQDRRPAPANGWPGPAIAAVPQGHLPETRPRACPDLAPRQAVESDDAGVRRESSPVPSPY